MHESCKRTSHPAGVRGLKSDGIVAERLDSAGRTPQGCVD